MAERHAALVHGARLGDWLDAQPYSLAMSSGFFGFFAHTGMLQSLTARASMRPRLVTGSSAGALVGGAWGAGLEPAHLAERLVKLRRDDFWDPAVGVGLLRGRKFDRLLRELLPVTSIERCGIPVAISVFDIVGRRTDVLRTGDLSAAIRASCAVPALFHPVWIGARAYWDGGILDRPGLAAIPAGDRVLFHHLASKSPWRTELTIPRRPGMVTLVLEGLPRSGPFKLDAGHRALELARDATLRALDQPIVEGLVRVSVR
jgi:NTE family protein